MACVYILACRDGSLYTGSTPDLERRIAEHRAGQGGAWTSKRLPVRLLFVEEMPPLEDAFHAERQIKGWRRAKKLALVRGELGALRELAATSRDASGRRT